MLHKDVSQAAFFIAGFKELDKGMTERQLVYLESIGTCAHYKARIENEIKISPKFLSAVKALPIVENETETHPKYFDLIKRFGTHYLEEAVMGAKCVMRHAFKAASFKKLQQRRVSIAEAAEASFQTCFGVSPSASAEQKSEALKQFESLRDSVSAMYLGSHPPQDGDWRTWAQRSYFQPYPVYYKLQEITNLFDPRNFEAVNAIELEQKRELMTKALKNYCKQVEGCRIPMQPEEEVFDSCSVVHKGKNFF